MRLLSKNGYNSLLRIKIAFISIFRRRLTNFDLAFLLPFHWCKISTKKPNSRRCQLKSFSRRNYDDVLKTFKKRLNNNFTGPKNAIKTAISDNVFAIDFYGEIPTAFSRSLVAS